MTLYNHLLTEYDKGDGLHCYIRLHICNRSKILVHWGSKLPMCVWEDLWEQNICWWHLRSWEWPLADDQQGNGVLHPKTKWKWILQATVWAWKITLSSRTQSIWHLDGDLVRLNVGVVFFAWTPMNRDNKCMFS